jgi:hypothetical protein
MLRNSVPSALKIDTLPLPGLDRFVKLSTRLAPGVTALLLSPGVSVCSNGALVSVAARRRRELGQRAQHVGELEAFDAHRAVAAGRGRLSVAVLPETVMV